MNETWQLWNKFTIFCSLEACLYIFLAKVTGVWPITSELNGIGCVWSNWSHHVLVAANGVFFSALFLFEITGKGEVGLQHLIHCDSLMTGY